MNIRDNVKSSSNKVSNESTLLSQEILKTSSHLLKLELYNDIINLEIGDTMFSRSRVLEREFDIRQLYIKFEGENPTGTQKDRIAFAQVYDALRRGFDIISLATCGNYGVACALAANLAHVKSKIFIPSTYHTHRIVEMEQLGAEIIRIDGTYEDVVIASSKQAEKNDWYDANPGGRNTPIQLLAYAGIADEIYDDLRDAPKYCAVPVSNGTLFAGIYRGFANLYKRGKTSRIPKMIAASSTGKNPIIDSYLKGFRECHDLDPKKIKETMINEPLINWHSFDGEEALAALWHTNGLAYNISDREMKDMTSFLLKKEGSKILPASTAGLIGMLKTQAAENLEPDRYVAVLTARN